MKPWWDNPEYHSATVDGKIAAWEARCKAIERQLQAALDHERLKVAALCEALDNPAQSSEQWCRWADGQARLVQPDIDPGNAHRRLHPSEILQDGDEFWCRNGEWHKTGDQGELVGNEIPYRRRREGQNTRHDRQQEVHHEEL